MPPLNSDTIDKAASLLDSAEALIVAAGAGMGVDSGLPDFCSNEGFWNAYPVLGRARIDFASMASPDQFEANPRRAWGFYGHRIALYRRKMPHAGFALLRQWGETMLHGYGVFTSNVDGQFQKAGFDAARLHECHGSLHHLQCLAPCNTAIWEADGFVPEVDADTCELKNEPPCCPACGGLARPNVMMFGDAGWNDRSSRGQALSLEQRLATVHRPLVVELGAGTTIPSMRLFSQRIIYEFEGRLIRINPRDCAVPTSRDVGLHMGAAEALAAIAEALK